MAHRRDASRHIHTLPAKRWHANPDTSAKDCKAQRRQRALRGLHRRDSKAPRSSPWDRSGTPHPILLQRRGAERPSKRGTGGARVDKAERNRDSTAPERRGYEGKTRAAVWGRFSKQARSQGLRSMHPPHDLRVTVGARKVTALTANWRCAQSSLRAVSLSSGCPGHTNPPAGGAGAAYGLFLAGADGLRSGLRLCGDSRLPIHPLVEA